MELFATLLMHRPMHKREDKTNRDASYLYLRRMINTRLHRPHVIDVSVLRVSLYVTPTQCTLVSSGQSVESYIQNVHVIKTLTDARTCSPSPTDRPSLSLSLSIVDRIQTFIHAAVLPAHCRSIHSPAPRPLSITLPTSRPARHPRLDPPSLALPQRGGTPPPP